MKTHRHLLLALALACSLSSAIAAPKAREVEDQMRSKNWARAEQMLNEVIAEKPSSAKAWYLLAQTQEQQRNLGSALSSLERARSLDPALKFASPGAADKMKRRLEKATGSTRSAAQPSIAPSAPSYQYERPAPRSETPAARYNAPTPILANQPSAAKSDSGSSFGGFLAVLLGLAALGGVGYFFYNRAASRKAADQRDTDRRALLSRALSAQTRAADLLKTARFEAPDTAFMALASSVASAADSALGRLKASASSSFSLRDEERKLQELESRIETAEAKAARKDWDEEAPAPAPAPAAAPTFNESFGSGSSQRRARDDDYDDFDRSARSGGSSRHYPQAPSTVVVQNDSSGGLLGAMVMADLLRDNGSSSRERDLERQLERERDRNDHDHHQRYDSAPAYEPPAPSYDEPAYEAPALDFGGSSSSSDSDGWGSSDSSSSSDIDTNKDEF